MSSLSAWARRLLHRRQAEQELDDEVQAYFEILIERYMARGLSREEAARAARVEFEGPEQVKDKVREARIGAAMETTLRDVRYAWRRLRKSPGFTAVAVLTLALGIGANTAIFSVVNAFLLKPLKIHNPEEVVGCYTRDTRKPGVYRAFSYPNYVDLRQKNTVFSSLAAHSPVEVGWAEGDTAGATLADVVSSNYFATLGVSLFKGRTFTSEEERPDSGMPVVIVSYPFWKKTGSDPELLGKALRINGRLFTVVGITPEGFTGTVALMSSAFYLPLGTDSLLANEVEGRGHSLSERDNHVLMLIGRLRSGVIDREADAQLTVVASQMEKAFPAENRNQTFFVHPLPRLSLSPDPVDDREARIPALLLMSMAAAVLSIVSLNLANMMLARGAARRREIAIRLAIGGARGRIVRQLCAEGFLLAILGGAAGLLVASWSGALLVSSLFRVGPLAALDLVYSSRPDIRVLAATTVFCLLSTIVFGLWPAWKLSQPDVRLDLKAGGDDRGEGAGRLFSRRNVLVMAQISLSLMMLTAAGLFVRSAMRAAHVEPGFSLDNEVLAVVDPSKSGYDEIRGRQIYTALLTRLKNVPGVESVSLAWTVPFGNAHMTLGVRPAENTGAAPVGAAFNIVTEDYFKTLGIPLLRGRTFLPAETLPGSAPRVAVIDKLAARQLWPNGDAVGKHLILFKPPMLGADEDLEVVGVVGSVQERIIGGALQPHLYVPFGREYRADMNIHLRVAAQGEQAQARMLETVRREIRAVDDRLPVLGLTTLRDHLDESLDLWVVKTGARILGIFGTIALLLAVIGLYGVKAYMVACRTREIGIRMALGASATDAMRLILREGLLVTAIGIGGGLVLALALGQVLAGLLYEVRPIDPVVLSLATLLLTAASMLACYLPARKAARVDPTVALRHE